MKLTKKKDEEKLDKNLLGKKTKPNNQYYEQELNAEMNKRNNKYYNIKEGRRDDKQKNHNNNNKFTKKINDKRGNKYGNNQFTKQTPTLRKKQICQFYINGACVKGNECTFSHEAEQVKKNVSIFMLNFRNFVNFSRQALAIKEMIACIRIIHYYFLVSIFMLWDFAKREVIVGEFIKVNLKKIFSLETK